MTTAQFCALVTHLDTAHFTLEDAELQDGTWVAYLYEARSAVTYRITDYQAYRASEAYLPTAWITQQPRLARNGHDYSSADAALTLSDVGCILEKELAGAVCQVHAVHVRYGEDDDDRYVLVVMSPAGRPQEIASLAGYLRTAQ